MTCYVLFSYRLLKPALRVAQPRYGGGCGYESEAPVPDEVRPVVGERVPYSGYPSVCTIGTIQDY